MISAKYMDILIDPKTGLEKSRYYDLIQKLPHECFYKVPENSEQIIKDNNMINFVCEYFNLNNNRGRKVIFNYKDNNIVKPKIRFYSAEQIILQSLIEEK